MFAYTYFLFLYIVWAFACLLGCGHDQGLDINKRVYILHGLNDAAESIELQAMEAKIMNGGYIVSRIPMSPGRSLDERTKEAEDFILDDDPGRDPLFLMGHSAGGLVGVGIAGENRVPHIRGVLTINAPLGGISALDSHDPCSVFLAQHFTNDLGSGNTWQLRAESPYLRGIRGAFPRDMPIFSIGSCCSMSSVVSGIASLVDGFNARGGELYHQLNGSDMAVPLKSQLAVKSWSHLQHKGVKSYEGYAHTFLPAYLTLAPSILSNASMYGEVIVPFVQDPLQVIQQFGIDSDMDQNVGVSPQCSIQ